MISEVFNVDCMDFMRGLPDNFADLAVCDPPYGINIASQGKIGNCSPFGNKKSFGEKNTKKRIIPSTDYGKKKWDNKAPENEYFAELIRVSKNQIIWGANHFISKIPFDSSCWLVWDKDNSGNYADCELAWTSFESVVKKFNFRWNGMLQGDMKNKEQRIHPTQKPIKLYQWIYHNYLPQGGKVLDTHLGSGSNRIAADMAGNIDFTACELDKEYFEAQEKRWREYNSQLKMF